MYYGVSDSCSVGGWSSKESWSEGPGDSGGASWPEPPLTLHPRPRRERSPSLAPSLPPSLPGLVRAGALSAPVDSTPPSHPAGWGCAWSTSA
jgi:hypothetical protein